MDLVTRQEGFRAIYPWGTGFKSENCWEFWFGMPKLRVVASRILGAERHGFWMPKLQVVELRICDAWRGFGRWVEPFVGFGCRFEVVVIEGIDMHACNL